ncbi:putative cytosine deaminase [Penicillium daleae]|uniref:Cytosine deaminase n=1 Tax=Penicillium daleae TaxID=63821 RepID=A0AAD6CEH3_9EURO|nr:putative cytosine deaminase [Penicillium daleae]KAJ5460773.1 putative cytosine deaminase [Penicillium daleae]
MITSTDTAFLYRCIDLAKEAVEAGDDPFGSLLLGANGKILKEERNRIHTESNLSLHPEFTLALWAEKNLSPADRAAATVYTSGEHCPMCAAAHAYAGLGRIVYASSSRQLAGWMEELGVGEGVVATLPVQQVAPGLVVDGPAINLREPIFELHRLRKERRDGAKAEV